jgi:hypothetical protein
VVQARSRVREATQYISHYLDQKLYSQEITEFTHEEEITYFGDRKYIFPPSRIDAEHLGAMREFGAVDKDDYMQYISNGKWFAIISRGPDGIYEQATISDIVEIKASLSWRQVEEQLIKVRYDPTNGTASRGDIFMVERGF